MLSLAVANSDPKRFHEATVILWAFPFVTIDALSGFLLSCEKKKNPSILQSVLQCNRERESSRERRETDRVVPMIIVPDKNVGLFVATNEIASIGRRTEFDNCDILCGALEQGDILEIKGG